MVSGSWFMELISNTIHALVHVKMSITCTISHHLRRQILGSLNWMVKMIPIDFVCFLDVSLM